MWAIAFCRASLMAKLFTDSSCCLLCFNEYVKSRRPQNLRDLCGIIAAGESLKFTGKACFISFQCTLVANPRLIFPCASSCMYLRAVGELADGWLPRVRAL